MIRTVPAPTRSRPPSRTAVTALAVAVLAGVAPAPVPAHAQEAAAGGASATPEAAVASLFDAMRAADSARARPLFHPEATLARPVEEASGVVLQRVPLQGFLDAIGSAEPGSLDERVGEVRVRRDGRLATAWMDYAFYLDGELHHCGVNAFQLYRTEAGWKIFGIADTSRTEGCAEEWGAD